MLTLSVANEVYKSGHVCSLAACFVLVNVVRASRSKSVHHDSCLPALHRLSFTACIQQFVPAFTPPWVFLLLCLHDLPFLGSPNSPLPGMRHSLPYHRRSLVCQSIRSGVQLRGTLGLAMVVSHARFSRAAVYPKTRSGPFGCLRCLRSARKWTQTAVRQEHSPPSCRATYLQ
jgi:hypothetical protein